MWAVIVAGGSGSRFGRPKQFESLAGRPVVEWSVTAARKATDGVVLVVPAGEEDRALSLGADVVVTGGETRSASVRRGLEHVPDQVDVVVVHDAARPLASPALFAAVVAPLLGAESEEDADGVDGVVCGIAIADTLKRVGGNGSTVTETVDRTSLVAVQTPQAFRAAVLRRAHAAGGDATDDAALVEAIGGKVCVVPGEAHNVKLTVPSDLALLEHLAGGGEW
ncbi:MAG: 2-C-methyl-D-erythritol 4-phosphate cytidylyltransferase [Actinomycetota bacterium]|nr:2-C-methyl-D-erythritol 4-phosphate cytidylyltransferase [Actinomycetota bacterium]